MKRVSAFFVISAMASGFSLLLIPSANAQPLPTTVKKARQCATAAGVGKNCITINPNKKGARAYRVRVTWKYQEPRNVGVPTPILRSSWQANVLCKSQTARIDILHFYDANSSEVMLTPEQQSSVVLGLESEALPAFTSSLCA